MIFPTRLLLPLLQKIVGKPIRQCRDLYNTLCLVDLKIRYRNDENQYLCSNVLTNEIKIQILYIYFVTCFIFSYNINGQVIKIGLVLYKMIWRGVEIRCCQNDGWAQIMHHVNTINYESNINMLIWERRLRTLNDWLHLFLNIS